MDLSTEDDGLAGSPKPAVTSSDEAKARALDKGEQHVPVDPEPTLAFSGQAVAHTAALSQQRLVKRRRGIGLVTANACNDCRKKRVKCDGRRPCGRCRVQRDVECIYELPVRQSKEDLRTEIDNLRHQQRSSNTVLSALTRSDMWEEVLQRLLNGEPVDNISDWVDAGGSAPRSNPHVPFSRKLSLPIPLSTSPYTAFSPGGVPSSSPGEMTGPGLGAVPSRTSGATDPRIATHPPSVYQQESSWHGPFSATSQAPSTGSNSHQEWGMPSQSRVGSWVENIDQEATGGMNDMPRYRGLDQVMAPVAPDMKVPASTWTNVSSDSDLVQHLLALYFCWEYPTFASLSKEHFLHDFHIGRQRHCSPILVNALLALGCRFSTQSHTRADPNDPYSSGDHFFKECQRLLYHEDDHHSLTTIQALGIMSIREASCGRDSESWYYAGQSIRLALEMGLNQIQDDGDDEETAVQAATFWGAFALDHAWSLATGTLPQTSYFPTLPPKPTIVSDIEASIWIPYTDDSVPLQRSCQQPSNVRSVYRCFCELSELVHRSLYILHSPGRPLASRDLLEIYTQYLNWYDSIPEVLRLGRNFTPAVLFAHMYYHFAILLLFRPLIKLRIINSSIKPKDVCLQAADAIQGLLRSYSQLYTLQRTPSFVPYFVLTSSIMHLAIGASSSTDRSADLTPKAAVSPTTSPGTATDLLQRLKVKAESHHTSRESSETTTGRSSRSKTRSRMQLDQSVITSINRGIADLTEMVPCHHFAEQALNILRYLAKKWNIDVQIDLVTKSPSGGIDEGNSARLLWKCVSRNRRQFVQRFFDRRQYVIDVLDGSFDNALNNILNYVLDHILNHVLNNFLSYAV